jgi:SAM-dependent methyltransferase
MSEPTVHARGDAPPRANTSRGTPEAVARLVLEHGTPRVLDAPCGEGALALLLGEEGCEVWGLDCEPDILRVDGVQFRQGDLQELLPFEDGFFGAVACVDGIEHVENPFHLVREFHRVLEPNGLLAVSTPNISAMRSRVRFLLTGFHNKFKRPLDESRRDPLHHITPLSFPRLRYILHTSGFEMTAVRANRAKPASWPYALCYPLSWLCTWLSLRRERDAEQRARNREILRALHSPAVFFGETLIVAARKL